MKNVQCFIKYGVPVFFHSWKEDKYLNIDLIGDICLTENATEDGLFCIEPYNYEELSDGSIVRVKHMKSEKYISLEVQQNKIQMIS